MKMIIANTYIFPFLLVLSFTVKLEPFNARDNLGAEGRMRATELLTEAS